MYQRVKAANQVAQVDVKIKKWRLSEYDPGANRKGKAKFGKAYWKMTGSSQDLGQD